MIDEVEFIVHNQALFVLSVLLLGSITVTIPSMAQAQVSVAQPKSNLQLKELLEQGRRLVYAGDYNGAIAVYQQAATLEPKNASIHSGIGYLYALQENFPKALASFRRAVTLNPNNSDYQYALGYVSGNLGDNVGAKEAYRRAIQLNRSNANAYLGLGIVDLRLGEDNNAMWAYEQAVNLDPNNPQAYELEGSISMKQGKSPEAIAVFQKARDLYKHQGKMESVARVEAMLRQLGA